MAKNKTTWNKTLKETAAVVAKPRPKAKVKVKTKVTCKDKPDIEAYCLQLENYADMETEFNRAFHWQMILSVYSSSNLPRSPFSKKFIKSCEKEIIRIVDYIKMTMMVVEDKNTVTTQKLVECTDPGEE